MAVPRWRAGWQRWVVALAAALAVAMAAWRVLWHGDTVRKAKKTKGGGGKGNGKGRVTVFNSYPAKGSKEWKDFSGGKYLGQFSGIKGKKSQKWVEQHNIVAVHSKDFKKLKGKWIRVKVGGRTIDARVVDECSDKDCSGCCTRNAGKTGFLLDLEASTAKRAGVKGGGGGVASYQVIDKPDPKYLMGTSAKF